MAAERRSDGVTIRELDGKNICMVGFGLEGQASLEALRKYAPKARVTVADSNPDLVVAGAEVQSGERYLEGLERFDWIVKTPGIPYWKFDQQLWPKLTSGTQIFLDTVHAAGAVTIGVTGTKGKSTTASLIVALLHADGQDVHLVGNIGRPMLGQLDEAKPGAVFVVELSSYQLERLEASPRVAVVTSFFPEHLDYHRGLEAYYAAKANIGKFQRPEDSIYYNREFEECRRIAEASPARLKVGFNADDCPVDINLTHLLGKHNASNMAAAYLVAKQFGVSEKAAGAALRDFQGLPHRLMSLGVKHGIEWVDDAISTTPESAMAAMAALGDRLGTMVLGGQDRGLSFDLLAEAIVGSDVATVVLYGESSERIGEALQRELGRCPRELMVERAETMAEVVKLAVEKTPSGKICLLSPASPSYDKYKNYEAKGAEFAAQIKGYTW